MAPEAEATRDLYERYARQIYAFCFHTLGDREEAEDATQSTFLNAFRGLKRGIEPEFESAWLHKIAQNVCLTKQRSSSRRRRIESPSDLDAMQDMLPSPSQETEELIRLPEALEGMPEQQRRALLLREWQGLSYKEIATELDLSQSAVEALLFRARRSLADGLSEEPKRGIAKRMRALADFGSVASLLKTLFFSGGAKIAAAVMTVAAGSVVAASPSVRHSLVDTVVPQHHAPAPAHIAPARHTAPAFSHPATVLNVPAHVTPARTHVVKHAPSARHPVAHTATPQVVEPAPTVTPAPASVVQEPAAPASVLPPAAAPPAAQKTHPVVPEPGPKPVKDHGNGNGNAKPGDTKGNGGTSSSSGGNGNGKSQGHGKKAASDPAQPPVAPPAAAASGGSSQGAGAAKSDNGKGNGSPQSTPDASALPAPDPSTAAPPPASDSPSPSSNPGNSGGVGNPGNPGKGPKK
jgi:RNA polymerase sigma factor (sigma-70 family)